MAKRCFQLAVLALLTSSLKARHVPFSARACADVFVGITVSSLLDSSPPRQLELVWANAQPQEGDVVALFDRPTFDAPPLAALSVATPDGYAATGVAAPVTDVATLAFTRTCLGFYAAYLRSGSVLASSCLETNPRWMEEMRAQISGLTLRTTFLPGVHDAAAYSAYDGSGENIIDKYTFTQEEDEVSLLVHGARYLDMRIAYRAGQPDVWWTNHGVNNLRPLKVTLDGVKRFLQNTEEIVIFDIHGLAGVDSDAIHAMLVSHLLLELGEWAAPSTLTWAATLGAVWASGRRLLVTYPDAGVAANNDALWPNVRHMWANTNNVEGLRAYGEQVFSSAPPLIGWAFMAELTPTPTDVALDRLGGLRKMAAAVNQEVSGWFSGEWGRTVNIVATDYFRGNTIVREAVEWNLFRSGASACARNATWSFAHARV